MENSYYFKRGLTVFNHVAHIGSKVAKFLGMFIKSTCCTNISCSTKYFLAPILFNFICSNKVHRLFLLHQWSPISIVLVFKHFLHWCSPKVSVTLMFINVQVWVAPMFTKFISTLMFINAQVLASPTFTNVQVLVPLMFTNCNVQVFTAPMFTGWLSARNWGSTQESSTPQSAQSATLPIFPPFLLRKGFSTIWTMSTASTMSAIS